MNEATIQAALKSAQIETSAPATTENTRSIAAWEKWGQFQTFNDPQLKRMLNAVADFVLEMKAGKKPRWLSLLGNSDAGKTYLARRIWKWFTQSPLYSATVKRDGHELIYPGQFCHWPAMVEELKSNLGYGRLADMQKEQLVIIDEIGLNRDTSGHVTEKLSTLLSCRTNKWTVITANLSLDAIAEQIDQRVASRMVRDGGVVVDVDVVPFALRSK